MVYNFDPVTPILPRFKSKNSDFWFIKLLSYKYRTIVIHNFQSHFWNKENSNESISLHIQYVHVSIYHELMKPCTYTKDKLMPQTKIGSPCPKVSSSFSVAHANCETTSQHVLYPFKIRLQNIPKIIHVGVCSIWFVSAIVFIFNAESSIAVDAVS
mgnify:CR=1 FL=1